MRVFVVSGLQFEARAELERRPQRQQVDVPQSAQATEVDSDDDDDIEVMSDRIRSIIADPESSFTYENISPDDMVGVISRLSSNYYPGMSAGFWLGGSMPPCRLRRRKF